MSAQISSDELLKVRANLDKLHGFFAGRASWSVDGEGGRNLSRVRGHLDGLDASLTRLMENNGVSQPAESGATVDLLPEGQLDPYKMSRFQAYLEQLELWFLERTECVLGEDLRATTSEVWGLLRATAAAAARIASRNQLDSAPPPRAAAVHPTPSAPAARRPTSAPGNGIPRGPTPKLILDAEQEPPLLDEIGDSYELSAAAREMLDDFLTEASLELNSRERHQLERKVERWLMTTPEGQQLVLKITDLHGTAAPYPTYRSRPGQQSDDDEY
jgi:hypothetical protein